MAPPAGRVLLTGANGFVATHIVKGLIDRKYHIVGTVRSIKKGEDVIAIHPEWKDSITWIKIENIGSPNAYDEAFTLGPYDYIIHNASPVDFTVTDFKKDMIDPAVKGTTALLEAAHKNGGAQLKRFVYSGSSAAVASYFQSIEKARKPWTEADWNDVTVEYAMKENDVVAAYLASKKVAEEAAWKFMADNKPSFDLTVLNPHVIIGPMLQPLAGPKNITGTNVFPIYNFLNGAYDKIEGLIFPGWHYVDARDVAKAHILSMTTPAASNKRIILVSGLITPQLVINAIRKNFPELHDRVIEGHPEILMPDGIDPTHWDASRSHEIFGPEWKYIDVETSVTDTVRNMLEHEKRWAAAGQ